jgi:hypothetical protein
MIGPTDLFHPSPASHLKTFQVFLIYCPKRPSFSTIWTALVNLFTVLCFGSYRIPERGRSICPSVYLFTSFTFMWPCIVTNFLIIKPTRCTNFEQDQDGTQFHPDPARKLSTNLYDIHGIQWLSVQWITPDDGQRNCPKHVEFHSKINLRN